MTRRGRAAERSATWPCWSWWRCSSKYTALLRKKQDRITEAVVCCKEALQARCEVFPDARDYHNSFYLFVTVGRLHATVAYVL